MATATRRPPVQALPGPETLPSFLDQFEQGYRVPRQAPPPLPEIPPEPPPPPPPPPRSTLGRIREMLAPIPGVVGQALMAPFSADARQQRQADAEAAIEWERGPEAIAATSRAPEPPVGVPQSEEASGLFGRALERILTGQREALRGQREVVEQTPGLREFSRAYADLLAGGIGTLGGVVQTPALLESIVGVETPVGRGAQAGAQALRQVAQGLQPPDPTFADKLVQGLGSTAPLLLTGVGAATLASRVFGFAPQAARWVGATAAALPEAAVEGTQTYQDLMDRGMTPQEAAGTAKWVMASNAVLLPLTNRLGFFGDKGRWARQLVMSSLMEGGQEAAQGTIQRLAVEGGLKPEDASGIAEEFLLGATIGSVFKGAQLGIQRAREGTPPTPAEPSGIPQPPIPERLALPTPQLALPPAPESVTAPPPDVQGPPIAQPEIPLERAPLEELLRRFNEYAERVAQEAPPPGPTAPITALRPPEIIEAPEALIPGAPVPVPPVPPAVIRGEEEVPLEEELVSGAPVPIPPPPPAVRPEAPVEPEEALVAGGPVAAPSPVTSPVPSAELPLPPQEVETPEVPTATVRKNNVRQGVEVKFSARPPAGVLQQLREAGFKWNRTRKLWYAKQTPKNEALARRLAEAAQVPELPVPPETAGQVMPAEVEAVPVPTPVERPPLPQEVGTQPPPDILRRPAASFQTIDEVDEAWQALMAYEQNLTPTQRGTVASILATKERELQARLAQLRNVATPEAPLPASTPVVSEAGLPPPPAEEPAEEPVAVPPTVQVGDRVTWTGQRGAELSGTIESISSDGSISIDTDQIVALGGRVPIYRETILTPTLSPQALSSLRKVEPDISLTQQAPAPEETPRPEARPGQRFQRGDKVLVFGRYIGTITAVSPTGADRYRVEYQRGPGMAVSSEVMEGETLRPIPAEEAAPPAADVQTPEAEPAPIPEVPANVRAAQQLANWVRGRLNLAEDIPSTDLFRQADQYFGGTQAQGTYTPKDAFDAMELGVNQFIAENLRRDLTAAHNPQAGLERLRTLVRHLPTQTRRTGEQEAFQQFSTPPHLGYLASWAANIQPGEVVLEPSAGLGGLAVFARNAGAQTVVNELSPRRAELLRQMGFDQVFTENAEQLHNILPPEIKPTVVLMNPPFSASAGRLGNKVSTQLAKQHLQQALVRLEPNGRLVAIVGKGMAEGQAAFKTWWNNLKQQYNVRANIGLPGKEYAKYGTTFENQLVVIDKTGPTPPQATLTQRVGSLEEALPLLEGIRNDRPATGIRPPERTAGEPAREAPPAIGGGIPGPEPALPPATVPVGAPVGGGALGEGALPVPPGELGGPPGLAAEPSASIPAGPEGGRGGGIGVGGPAVPGPVEPSPVPAPTPQPTPAAVEPTLTVEAQQAPVAEAGGDISTSIYEPYAPQKLRIPGAKPHPGKLVQSAAMASVEPPNPTYTPRLPKGILDKLSIAQLETITYAGQAHQRILPEGARQGFFIGDGTGVGKGREIAGILLDNFAQGRTKAVWVSTNGKLFNDAKRDFGDTGGDVSLLFDLSKVQGASDIKPEKGVAFTTYSTLRSSAKQSRDAAGHVVPGQKRLDQLANWLGETFDGVIAFDESHLMANALQQKGTRGIQQASAQALAGIDLQKKLPKARIVYVSATGATEVSNLAYAERLGLWGAGTPFANVQAFVNQIKAGGLAAMELVARDLKARGLYISRNLSFDDVTYETLEHPLTPEQRDIYNTLVESWQLVLRNVNEALQLTASNDQGTRVSGQAKSAAMSAFWGSHQRFFNQIITSMQMPSVLNRIREDLTRGEAAVLQLVNTNEAMQERRLAEIEEELTPEALAGLDMTPRDHLMQYVQNSFPVAQYETYVDENGNERFRQVLDSSGRPVQNADAVAMREQLLDELGSIRVPDGPLEMLLNAFGPDAVAEVTGRTRRVVRTRDAEGEQTEVQRRGEAAALADARAFQDDRKQILVFSDAGGTGQSYHASLATPNQRKRQHYLVQPGWRADRAVQGMGRTHRTNEASAPNYVLVTTDLKGQKRFLSSIARRLDQLGALTKGQRQTGGQGLFSARDNLESEYAQDAMRQFWGRLSRNQLAGLDFEAVTRQMGLDLIDPQTGNLKLELPTVTQFLNRILSLHIDLQNQVFEAFFGLIEQQVANAIAAGTLDVGVETVKALNTEVASEQTVFTDPESGAETRYVHLQLTHPRRVTSWQDIEAVRLQKGRDFLGYYLNDTSGRVSSVVHGASRTTAQGHIVETFISRSPTSLLILEQADVDRLTALSAADAKRLWTETAASAPTTYTEDMHIITGALLPIWDRVPGKTRVVRLQSDDGRRFLGRFIEPRTLQQTLQNLGATASAPRITPEAAVRKILDERYTMRLANGWTVSQRRVSGEPRLEIRNDPQGIPYADMQALTRAGAFTERIQWETRVFLPTGPESGSVFGAITQYRPVVSVEPPIRSGEDVLAMQRGVQPPSVPAEEPAAPVTPPAPPPPQPAAPEEAPPPPGPSNPEMPDPEPRNRGLSHLAGDEEGSVAMTWLGDISDAIIHAANITRPKLYGFQAQAPDVYEAALRHAAAVDHGRVIGRGFYEAMSRIVPGSRSTKERYLHNFARYWNSEMGKGIRRDPERAEKVRVKILDPDEEDALLDDPVFQKLVMYYRQHVQPMMEELAPSAGIHTFIETPSGFYGKLHALKREDDATDPASIKSRLQASIPKYTVGYTGTGQIPRQLSRKRARAALQARGTGVYSEDLQDMLEHMVVDRFTAAYKNQLIEVVQRYKVPVNRVTRKAPPDVGFAGAKVPVVLSDVGTAKARALARGLAGVPLEDIWLPKPVEEAWREVTVGSRWDEFRVPILSNMSSLLTNIMLLSPADAIIHGLNVFHALSNAPGVGQSMGTPGRVMAQVPLLRFLATMGDIFNIPGSEMDRVLPILAEYGGLRTSMFGEAGKGAPALFASVGERVGGAPGRRVGRRAGEAFTVFKRYTFDYPSYGRGIKGMESRARVALYKTMEYKYPEMSPAERVSRINNFLGTYLPGLQPAMIKMLRVFGLGNPFAVATATLMKTGVKGLAGMGPAGFSLETGLTNWIAVPIALYLLSSLLDPEGDRREPWEQPGWDPNQIRIWSSPTETVSVPIRYIFNSIYRGLRATGLAAVGQAVAAGEKDPSELTKIWLRNGFNVALSLVSSPFSGFVLGSSMGKALYFTPRGELMSLEKPTERPSIIRRLGTGLQQAVPFAKELGESERVTGFIDELLDPIQTPNPQAVNQKMQTLLGEVVSVVEFVAAFAGLKLKKGLPERELASLPGRAAMGRMYEVAQSIATEVRRAPLEERAVLLRKLMQQRIRPEHYPLAMRAIVQSLRGQTRSIARHTPRPPLPTLPPTGTEPLPRPPGVP